MPLEIAKQLPATFNLENINLLYIANIRFLQCNPNEISLPRSKAAEFGLKFHTRYLE